MKAVILLAGIGNRLRPLTLDKPKSLLPIGNSTVLEHMITKLQKHGIHSFVIVCGHMEEMIKTYLAETFPELDVIFATNEKYLTTNTGYSLLVAKEYLNGETFIKLDGDVIFDDKIIKKLTSVNDEQSYVCSDSTSLDEEVIKIICNDEGYVVRIGNKLPATKAIGESIGIERISKKTSLALFAALETMMIHEDNLQNYYEVAYDEIIQAGVDFKAIDITGLKWVEMDNRQDYEMAQSYFGSKKTSLQI
ncbi:MAG: phosphocholine cytidylyltransferase family protein [Candidatus Saccharimonadales bacterium]